MREIRAADALADDLIEARAEQRAAVIELRDNTIYAVYDHTDDGERVFLGLVTNERIATNPKRILADLIPDPAPPAVKSENCLDCVKKILDENRQPAAPVMDNAGRLSGAVTHASLLNALTEYQTGAGSDGRGQSHRVAGDRAITRSDGSHMQELAEALNSLLKLLPHTRIERDVLQEGINILTSALRVRFGAIGITDENRAMIEFVFAGISAEAATKIPRLPEGKGLLGLVLSHQGVLRMDDLSKHPDAAGFPAGHPPMKSLLAAPIAYDNTVHGRLYLCDKCDDTPFTDDDEVMVRTFAETLALAIENTREHAHLQMAEKQMRIAANVFETSSEGIIITDANQSIIMVNRAFTTITGFRADEMIGRTPAVLHSGRQDSSFYRRMWRALEEDGQWQGEIWNKRKNGEIYREWLSISVLTDEDGKASHYIGVFSERSARNLSDAHLHRLAHYDPLTDLPNRELFRDILKASMLRAHRMRKLMALLILDVDRFKSVNDTFGHRIGDQLLQHVADRLKKCLRKGGKTRVKDTVCRLSGDEFAIILDDMAGREDAVTVAEKILLNFRQVFILGSHQRNITVSIGIALYPEDGDNMDELIHSADLAMYQTKTDGKNHFRIYRPEMREQCALRLKLECDLHGALDRNEFEVCYQPQIDLFSGEIVGMEALLRWRHPRFGTVLPDKFIPLLEENDLIQSVGEWVLLQACNQCMEWRTALGRPLYISVNLSGRQLKEDIVTIVTQTLAQSGLDSSCLVLELTESVAMNHVDSTIRLFEALNRLGVTVSIDDFGTGYSSLSYLHKFGIKILKIDKSFLADLDARESSKTIVHAIIHLAHNLKMKVIAEGVETEEQLCYLRESQCGFGQGNLFSRPLSAGEITPLIDKGGFPPFQHPK